MGKKITAFILILSLCLVPLVTSCSQGAPDMAEGVVITDMAGREVTVPSDPQSICVLDAYAAPLVVMLGYGEKMPTTINAVSRDILLQSICPALADSIVVKTSGSVNAEAVLEMNTDLIILSEETYLDTDERAKIETLNIPYIVVTYTNMEEQMEVARLLGEALQAEDMAKQYIDYYQDCIDLVSEGCRDVPEEEIQTLYHSVNEATRTDYTGSLCADWIALTRVTNVSLDTQLSLEGDKAYTTLEQIYEWDPDLIICNESGVALYPSDSKVDRAPAVVSGMSLNAHRAVRWGHPSSIETPLAILAGELCSRSGSISTSGPK
jgi:iron complex transport system substrate-binding protein